MATSNRAIVKLQLEHVAAYLMSMKEMIMALMVVD